MFNRRGVTNKSRVIKEVTIPGIGHAQQLANGIVSIHYADDSKLSVDPSSSKIMYKDSSGRSSHYNQNDVIPDDTREKLTHTHRVFEALMKS